MDKGASLLVSVDGVVGQSEEPCVYMPGLRGKGDLLCNKKAMGLKMQKAMARLKSLCAY